MTSINNFKYEDSLQIQNVIEGFHNQFGTIEQTGQEFMNLLYNKLTDSIVLCRFFLTVELVNLPDENRRFVNNLTKPFKIKNKLDLNSLVLTLLGTKGENPEWNDRRNSKGHIGIPLLSADFIDKIPMMSRLLKQMGMNLEWIDSDIQTSTRKSFGSLSGVFYVHNASTDKDSKDRYIISAQDFVKEYNVKSVFGFGGGFIGNPIFFTVIIFLRENIAKVQAEKFISIANSFKFITMHLVEQRKIFN